MHPFLFSGYQFSWKVAKISRKGCVITKFLLFFVENFRSCMLKAVEGTSSRNIRPGLPVRPQGSSEIAWCCEVSNFKVGILSPRPKMTDCFMARLGPEGICIFHYQRKLVNLIYRRMNTVDYEEQELAAACRSVPF